MKNKFDFKNIYYSFKIVVKASPLYFLLIACINFTLGFILAYNTVRLDQFLNVVDYYIKGKVDISIVFVNFLILLLTILANPVFNGINTTLSSDFELKVQGKIEKEFNLKCSKVSPIKFESSEYLNTINKAHKGINSIVQLVTGLSLGIFTYIPYFITLGIYLYRIRPILIFILFLFIIGPILSQMFKKKLYARLENNVSYFRRECDHYKECLIASDKLKETRMLGAFHFFMGRYKDKLKVMNRESLDTQVKSSKIEFIFKIPLFIANIISLLMLSKYLMGGFISIGNFGAVIGSINMLMMMAEEFIFYVIGSAIKQVVYVENYINFIEVKDKEYKKISMESPPEIVLHNISFTYPLSKTKSLSNINLVINRGDTIAIVGENGSGKSTLASIIGGIYRPTSGFISYDGRNPCKEDEDISLNVSAVFQNFCKYKMSLFDNIVISDFSKNISDFSIRESLKKSNLVLNKSVFPKGMETMLSRDFGGVDLSGGQWQKVAIARGLYKGSKIIILDEPTSAIDPIEKSGLFNNFLTMAKGKTAIIITHRMAMTRFVDKIIVMDKGCVREFGSHEELMEKKGLYKDLYLSQSRAYKG